LRPRLRLPRPARPAARRLRHRLEERPLAPRRAAVVPARPAGRARRVPAVGDVRARDAAGQGRRSQQRAVRGALALAALTLAGCGGNDEPRFLVGAVDDAVRHEGPALSQLEDAGFGAVAITSQWQPGVEAPSEEEIAVIRGVVERASEDTRIFLAVYHPGSATTPLTPDARAQFAAYVTALMRDAPEIRDVIIGNEPNLNRFWMPQFDAEGGNVAAPAYLALLIEVYAAVKKADPEMTVWGGALAARGIDRPGTGRDTHSPTTFIRDLGAAYRASRLEEPPLDGFAYHPYPASSSAAPDEPTNPSSSTILLADYEEKLRPLLDEAFGPGLPVLYAELGIETVIPPGKRQLYEGEEPGRPVDDATQADYYRRAIELAACQPNVAGLLLFHSHDEPSLVGFQSGVYYVDGTPKESLEPVRKAIENAGLDCQ
jgi:hypothetical protein